MSRTSPPSPVLQEAAEILDSAKGKILTIGQRQKLAVELAALMLTEANKIQTRSEKKRQAELARMMKDPRGKAFTTTMTDQCFRSKKSARVAHQMIYLLNQFGIPRYLDFSKQLSLAAFQWIGRALSPIFVPLATWTLRRQTKTVILPGEKNALSKHMRKRRKEGVRLNLNHLGEAILGEDEAQHRLNVYLHDLAEDDIEYVSIKISTIFSQINLLGWEQTIEALSDRLRQLYRVAKVSTFVRADGSHAPKFVNLDMEEYRDLKLTVELFKKVLDEPEFKEFSAGIVLQAYLPDAHEIQRELTEWAKERVKNKGAPIKIRIVKGANLAMEQVEASLRGWAQAPYTDKIGVDANYKRMVAYGCLPEHAKAVHIGVASHNLFDIAYALLLRAEYSVEKEVSFEMLEGMADHIRRVVQKLSKDILLYCPVATKKDFQSAVAYLIRRLDENTGPENFLRHTFGLKPGSCEWENQVKRFAEACDEITHTQVGPRRHQNRFEPPQGLDPKSPFENESDTDFALPHNREWVVQIVNTWKNKKNDSVPCIIGGTEYREARPRGEGEDPSKPRAFAYTYTLAGWAQVDQALSTAKSYEAVWAQTSIEKRCDLLAKAAQKLRDSRGDLIGVMLLDGGKTPYESDPEISEAIDFAEYYRRSAIKIDSCKDLQWKPKGTYLVAPPWNFPVSIPTGGILGALVIGNCVIFKPAPEAVLSGWVLVNALWDAGIPKEALQFICCEDDPVGSKLIKDPRLNGVILTGATSTARLFMKMRPDLDLSAETGGKNAMIITALSDRDLAIKDLIQSAFGHSGQKCSAASLAILEAEVYDDPHFRQQLKDAIMSLKVGPAWNLSSKVTPLIREPSDVLLRGLTTLEKGEEWLVKPHQDPSNPNLWSPGVKWGVKEGSFMHQTELFGPVLAVMRAKNLEHAIQIANETPYGLTSGLQSLDPREQKFWILKIEAGNLYINRSTTGAIVRRQPFGGCKASSFGHGAKAGGPNYVHQFAHPKEVALPKEKAPISAAVENLSHLIEKIPFTTEQLGVWYASASNYAFWGHRFKHDHDPSRILGQDNLFQYRSYMGICLRIQTDDAPLDILRSLAAALTCETPIQISFTKGNTPLLISDQWKHLMPLFRIVEESEAHFLQRVQAGAFKRIRLLSKPALALLAAASESFCHVDDAPVLSSGRFELLHYLREVAISCDYHRYGNLGVREGEVRKPVL
ncbi:MAG TPA: bifunctional proline dehydrogenase/L-glutamate gamma-semialdehyde dehydrogenase [Rhabdochlamydiaceae bacterium]|nr:bifunctional proline dehydrogenase/L-glutamate gamma-semialdehyde dehydrogenase [Rhabdochlamydiaceae bacterium]